MWQFIPETGSRFGLKIGPLAAFPKADPADDRHQWEKATEAAARYIKEIYSTDAQASGLLVMASYNWGEQRVINMLRTMPANPRERNFWKLLERYRERVPKETYDYVLNIVAAAVIGENPRLFGFPFDSPLASSTGDELTRRRANSTQRPRRLQRETQKFSACSALNVVFPSARGRITGNECRVAVNWHGQPG